MLRVFNLAIFNKKRAIRKLYLDRVIFGGLLKVPEALVDLAFKKIEAINDSIMTDDFGRGQGGRLAASEIVPILKEYLPEHLANRIGESSYPMDLTISIYPTSKLSTHEFFDGAFYPSGTGEEADGDFDEEVVTTVDQDLLLIEIPISVIKNRGALPAYERMVKTTLRHELRHFIQGIANSLLGGSAWRTDDKGGFGLEKMDGATVDRYNAPDMYFSSGVEFQPWIGSLVDILWSETEDEIKVHASIRDFVGLYVDPKIKKENASDIGERILLPKVKRAHMRYMFLKTLMRVNPEKYKKAIKYIYLNLQEKLSQFLDKNPQVYHDPESYID